VQLLFYHTEQAGVCPDGRATGEKTQVVSLHCRSSTGTVSLWFFSAAFSEFIVLLELKKG
jgi:hypothetical protein